MKQVMSVEKSKHLSEAFVNTNGLSKYSEWLLFSVTFLFVYLCLND